MTRDEQVNTVQVSDADRAESLVHVNRLMRPLPRTGFCWLGIASESTSAVPGKANREVCVSMQDVKAL